MKYMMECPMCHYMLNVDADDDMEAMSKMKDTGGKHLMEMHKDAPPMSDDDMEKMIKNSWKKEW